MPIAGRNSSFKNGQAGLAGLSSNDKFGALDRGIEIWRVDFKRAWAAAERLESPLGKIKQRTLLLVRRDIDEIYRAVLIDAKHGLVDEHHCRTAEGACPDRIVRAERLIEYPALPRAVALHCYFAIDRVKLPDG